MLGIIKLPGTPSVFEFKGTVDESAQFDKLIPADEFELQIRCREVTRINSLGIKEWFTFFGRVREQGRKVKFIELSPALVCQAGWVQNFILPEEVFSFCVPYQCQTCAQNFLKVFEVPELKNNNLLLPTVDCPNCQKPAELDEIEDQYLSFLKKPGRS
jgi:hypothetical protein